MAIKNFAILSSAAIANGLKKAATGIESIIGTKDFGGLDVSHLPDATSIRFNASGLTDSELEVSHDYEVVRLRVRPYNMGYLIPDESCLVRADTERLRKFVQKHGSLRWSTCTAKELHQFFAEWLLDVDAYVGDCTWQNRALNMLAPLVPGVIRMRDEDGEKAQKHLWKLLSLDSYVALIGDKNFDQVQIRGYLSTLPGFSFDDAEANCLSPKCYEQHGFLVMQVSHLLSKSEGNYEERSFKLHPKEFTHRASRPITSVEAHRVGDCLRIRLNHPAKEFVPVKIEQ